MHETGTADPSQNPGRKKFHLLSTTEGCATNLLENTGYRDLYMSQGMVPSQGADDADLILINTCAYSQEMENRATSVISDFQKRYPGKQIVLAGCLPKINPVKVKEVFRGTVMKTHPRTDQFFRQHQFNQADFERLSNKHKLVLRMRPYYYRLESFFGRKLNPLHNLLRSVVVNEKFYLLTVSTGCVGKCTFCAIKRAKGSLKSRPIATLMTEFEQGLAAGFQDFWLLGDDIGCYGQDVGLSVVDLLRAILARPERFSLVLNYMDPHFLCRYGDELVELLSDSRLIGVNIPIQSGSPGILKAMERNYDPKAVYAILKRIKKRNPGLAIKTNIMVGFPSETFRDFSRSIAAVFRFDAVLALRFAPRPHTPAEKYSKQIPEPVKHFRHALINAFILMRHAWVVLNSVRG